MSRTAFVTGATGFLGLNLTAQLLMDGWRVVAMHRPSSDLTYLRRLPAERVVGSVEIPEAIDRAMPEAPDAVFHVAADVSFWSKHNARQTRTNVEGTRNVVAAALKKGAGRFVHTSSIAVYGLDQPPGFVETALKRGAGSRINYMRTKADAELEVRRGIDRGLDAVILNPANIVGPYDQANWARVFRLVAEGRIPGTPPGRCSFCHVEAVAEAHHAAFERGRTGENYLLGGADAYYREAWQLVAELVGKPEVLRELSTGITRVAGTLYGWAGMLTGREPDLTPELAALLSAEQTCSSAKAVRELGYREVPLREMFEDCYRWLVAEGKLPARAAT